MEEFWMVLKIIDYSEVYFLDLCEEEVPPLRKGKFVVLEKFQEKYLIFSPYSLSQYHANIVERFLNGLKVEGTYNLKGDHYFLDSSEWTILGGGHWKMDEEEGLLVLSGFSQSYGGVNLKALAEEIQETGTFGKIQIFGE